MKHSTQVFLAMAILLQIFSAKALLPRGRILPGDVKGLAAAAGASGGKDSESKAINAQTSIFNPEKQTKLYELRRLQMTQMDSINEDLTHMEVNLNSLKDMVKTRIDQMHQILDSSLNSNKVFKVTVDNIAN